jgi:hypothetical protein
MTVVIGEPVPYYYSVTCWRDDCPGGLDTYGNGPWVIDLAKEHVEEFGCTLNVEVKSHIEVKPQEQS